MVSEHSPEGSRSSSPAPTRQRASTLSSQQPPNVSPANHSRFGLLRGNSKKTPTLPSQGAGVPKEKGFQPSSFIWSDEAGSRLSFGLPKLSADPTKPVFDGLGLSPTRSMTSNGSRSSSDPHRQNATARPPSFPPANGQSYGHRGLDLGNVDLSERNTSRAIGRSSAATRARTSQGEIDAAEGWRNEQVLYQCACVAELSVLSYSVSEFELMPHQRPGWTGQSDIQGIKVLDDRPGRSCRVGALARREGLEADVLEACSMRSGG